MVAQAKSKDMLPILDNLNRFMKVKCSSGHKHALKEVLSDSSILERLKDVKAASDVAVLKKFQDTLNLDPTKAVYGIFFFFDLIQNLFSLNLKGFKYVKEACDGSAIDTLLITNELFKVEDVALRKVYVGLTEEVKAKGGNVFIFSTMHPSGEQLKGISN